MNAVVPNLIRREVHRLQSQADRGVIALLELRFRFPNQLPRGAVQCFGEPQDRVQARVAQSALDEAYIGRVARRLGRQRLL